MQDLNVQQGGSQRIETNNHSLRIRVKKRGLAVRSLFGFTDAVLRDMPGPAGIPRVRSARHILSTSPLVAGNLDVSAEALPFYSPQKESLIRAVIHIDGTGLSFRPVPEDGYRIAEVTITGTVFSSEGRMLNNYRGSGTFRAPVQDFTGRIRRTFASTIDIPVPGPGLYELRSSVIQGGKLGNVSLLVDVPDFASSGLAASGMATFNTGKGPGSMADPGVSTRKLRRSNPFVCSFTVYNARREGGKADIEAQLRLYRDDVLVKASEVLPISNGNGDEGANEIPVRFEIDPGPELTAGDYLVEVVVVDRLAGKKRGTITQSAAIELAD